MKITWYGTAAVKIESGDTKVLFDPFCRMNKRMERIHISSFTGADAIFATHGHFDHILNIPDIIKLDKSVPVYGTEITKENLNKLGADSSRINVIKPGDTVTLGNIKITAKQGKHIEQDKFYLKKIYVRDTVNWPVFFYLFRLFKALPENGEILIYEVECEGKTVTILGSLGVDENTDYKEKPDIMIFPYAGSLAIAEKAYPVLKKIKPEKIIFDHFDNSFPPLTFKMNVEGFRKLLAKTMPATDTIIPEEKVTMVF